MGRRVSHSEPLKMESLLGHLVEITGHRDHDLLDISIMSALLNMVGVDQARVLELFQSHGDLLVRPRVWISDNKVHTLDEENSPADHPCEPIVNFPCLVNCIAQHKNRMEEARLDGNHALWIPIWQNDKVSTCLEIVNDTPFTPQMLQVMEGILSVYRNYQSLLDYSERDSLTGLLNRKTFDEKFARMISSKMHEPADCDDRRHHTNIKSQWLAVVDIDHFKRVNDRFGHLYGDEVLILVANVLRSSFRSQDRVFRFGGEEFVILLRSTTLDDARMIFDRFRSNIEQHAFPQVGQITVSIGFAAITQETPVVILGHADQALYHAKESGRNRVCYYDELINQGLIDNDKKNDSFEFFFDEPSTS
jgi:diguanylate cyclase (GGDEF)-like protein